MKRSEMIDIMVNAGWDPFYFDEEHANDILTAIEKAGMTPPAIHKEKQGPLERAWNYRFAKWEPEDDSHDTKLLHESLRASDKKGNK